MCLDRNLTKNPLKRADIDIVCYKVVEVPYLKRYKSTTWLLRKLKCFKDYETYYRRYPITFGKIFIAYPVFSEEELHFIDHNQHSIGEGFIHSFKNKDDAIKIAKRWTYIDVVECIIPAGTYYFEGRNNGLTDGYASTQLKYVKVV